MGSKSTILTVNSGNHRYDADDYENWDGMKIGVLGDNSQNANLANFAYEHHFTYSTISFDNELKLQKALKANKVDAIVSSNLRHLDNEWIIAQFNPTPFYFCTRKNDTKLMAKLNAANKQLITNEPNIANELFNKYYAPDNGDEIYFTASERKLIKEHQSSDTALTAIINPDRNPYSYYDDKKMKGSNVEIALAVMKLTGMKVKIIQTKTRTAFNKYLKSGKADLVLDSAYNFSLAAKENYILTHPYFQTSLSALYLRNNNPNNAKRVAVVSNLADELPEFYDSISNKEIIKCASVNECIDALSQNKADVTYFFTNIAQYIDNNDVRNKYSVSKVPLFNPTFTIAVNQKRDAELAAIITKASSSIDDEQIADIVNKYSNFYDKNTSLITVIYSNPLWALLIIGLILLAIVMIILYFISHIHRKREEKLNQSLSKALNDAQQANEAKTQFFANMSHDMRTPMNGILGLTKLSKDKEMSDDVRDYLDKIESSGEYLLWLINDALDMSKIESNKLTLREEVVDYRPLIERILDVARMYAKDNDVKIVYHEENMVDCHVKIDQVRLTQIFLNMISNAVKFSHRGGTVEIGCIVEKIHDNVADCKFFVKDYGIGMSEAFKDKLFIPFQQENRKTNNIYTGTGLGMSITKRLVELMNGSIDVDTKEDVGTLITIRMPIILVSDYKLEPEFKTVIPDLQGCRVLLCEDHPLNQEIAVAILGKAGIKTDVAINGQKGVELFSQSEPGYYDAILMDIRMPIMDGLSATKVIRALDRKDAKTIPILAMTANAFEEDARACKDAGMNAHLSKPIESDKLFSELGSLIENYHNHK